MRAILVLTALFLVVASAAFVPKATAELLIQEGSSVSGPLQDFYIAMHRPDGSCETVEVYASSLEDAMKLAKGNRCESCTVEDVSATMRYSSRLPSSQMANACPLR